MTETTAPGQMRLDPDAIDTHTATAVRAATRLGDAAAATATATATADLSGLGILGRRFAAAWTQAAADHTVTLDTAARLIDAMGTTLHTHGDTMVAIDTETARRIERTEEIV